MKKLIMLAAVAVLACAGHAASVSWSVTYAGKGDAWAANGATVMAFAAADYDSIVKLVTVDGSDTLKADLEAKSLGSSTFKNNRGNAALPATVATDDAPDSMFWMIFSDGSWDGGKAVTWTAATDVKSAQYVPPATGSTFGITAANFVNSGTIASSNVPEPTSGLLLLIGMAGLALKRKSA